MMSLGYNDKCASLIVCFFKNKTKNISLANVKPYHKLIFEDSKKTAGIDQYVFKKVSKAVCQKCLQSCFVNELFPWGFLEAGVQDHQKMLILRV